MMNKKDIRLYLVFILIIALAFFLRFYHLDERVFHHDEAAVGYFTYRLFNDNVYSYDPSFHGPFMYYVTAEMYRRMGDSDFSSRFLPALLGAGMIFLLIPLRKYIANAGMVLGAFFLAVSPSFLYYSRFYREDIFISFFTLLALVCAVKYAEMCADGNYPSLRYYYLAAGAIVLLSTAVLWIELPWLASRMQDIPRLIAYITIPLIILSFMLMGRSGYPAMRFFYLFIGGFAIAAMAALKENAYISMALIALFLFLLFMRERWYTGLMAKLKKPDRIMLIIVGEMLLLILVFLVIFSLFYTGNVLDVHGMKAAVEKAISHWYEMHRIQRMGGPYFFYLPIMALYELPVLVFGILGMVYYGLRDRKKERLLALLLIYWVALDIMYLISGTYPSAAGYLPTSYIQSSTLIFFPLLVLGITGVLYIRNLFFAFLIYWGLTNFFVYSYVQEKVPWLVLNPLLPLAIIAAAYLGEVLPRLIKMPDTGSTASSPERIIMTAPAVTDTESSEPMIPWRDNPLIHLILRFIRPKPGATAVIFLLASSILMVHASLQLNYYNYTNPAEPLIQAAQPPQKFSQFLHTVKEISSQYQNQSTPIQLTDVNLETQFLWYMRHYSEIKWKVRLDSVLDAPLIVVHDSDGESEAEVVGRDLSSDYKRLDSAKMSWYWFQPSDITPSYVLFRKMDREPGEYRFVLFYKPRV